MPILELWFQYKDRTAPNMCPEKVTVVTFGLREHFKGQSPTEMLVGQVIGIKVYRLRLYRTSYLINLAFLTVIFGNSQVKLLLTVIFGNS